MTAEENQKLHHPSPILSETETNNHPTRFQLQLHSQSYWFRHVANRCEQYTIKLNSVPVGQWDGALILLPPFEDDDSGAKEPEH